MEEWHAEAIQGLAHELQVTSKLFYIPPVKNATVRTIPAMQDHASFFANMQLPEQRKFRPKAGGALISTIHTLSENAQGPNPAI